MKPGGDLRVAAVQAAPVFLERGPTVDKARSLIAEAGGNGAALVAFPENFLPGHPLWFHSLPPTDHRSMALATRLVDNAVTLPGPEVDALAEAAASAGVMVVIGVVERPDPLVSVIHSSHLVLGADGTIIGVRRKLVPAVGERVFLTPGGGDSVRAFESPWGPLSVLGGGENSNPLLTYAMRSLGARIHVALWPPHFHKPGIMHNIMTITGRAIAYQNSAHVIAVAGAVDPSGTADIAGSEEHRANLEAMTNDPGSVVIAPRGDPVAGPQHGEGILYADIDLSSGTWAQLVNRQYDRPDVLQLTVHDRPTHEGVHFTGRDPGETDHEAAHARSLIAYRFGDALSSAEVEELVPYVVSTLRRSEALAMHDLTTTDPRDTEYVRSVNEKSGH
jgi:aliphatic nitrilase